MSQGKPSQRLDMKMKLYAGRRDAARELFWNHPRVSELIPSMLFRMHAEARATIKLMEMAIESLVPNRSADPLAEPLIDFFTHHIPEETGHDDWLLQGLEALGFDRREVLARVPPPTIASMVGAQYYWILHHHPLALIGYIKVVEDSPNSLEEIEAVIERTGLPREAFRSHIGHVDLEPKHNEDLDRLVDSLPLTAQDEALLGVSVLQTLTDIAIGLEEIVRIHEQGKETRPPMDTLPAAERSAAAELF